MNYPQLNSKKNFVSSQLNRLFWSIVHIYLLLLLSSLQTKSI